MWGGFQDLIKVVDGDTLVNVVNETNDFDEEQSELVILSTKFIAEGLALVETWITYWPKCWTNKFADATRRLIKTEVNVKQCMKIQEKHNW